MDLREERGEREEGERGGGRGRGSCNVDPDSIYKLLTDLSEVD